MMDVDFETYFKFKKHLMKQLNRDDEIELKKVSKPKRDAAFFLMNLGKSDYDVEVNAEEVKNNKWNINIKKHFK